MLNLFALVKDPAKRVQRFSLEADVQTQLTAYLNAQEVSFNEATEEYVFDGKYKPDAGELLVIEDFDDIYGLGAAIKNPLGAHEVDPTPEFFERVQALFSGRVEQDGSVTVLLQNFDRRKILSNKGFSIFHSGNTFKRVEGTGLTIDWKLAAVLNGKRLRFQSFHNARQIFDLSDHYIEATDADISAFVDLAEVKGVKDQLVLVADTWIRRKLALIQQSQILTKVPLGEIKAAAVGFGIEIELVDTNGQMQLVMPSEKASLKTLLRFLDEDYYESPLSKTQFITNSKREAKKKAGV